MGSERSTASETTPGPPITMTRDARRAGADAAGSASRVVRKTGTWRAAAHAAIATASGQVSPDATIASPVAGTRVATCAAVS